VKSLRKATLSAKGNLVKVKRLKGELAEATARTGKGFASAGRALGQSDDAIFSALHKNITARDQKKKELNQAVGQFKRSNATKRSLRATGSRGKQGRLF
jgi:hypothetical protein